MLDTKCALFICFYQAQVFCKKLLIESEEKLDFIGALICNIKLRLNSAANLSYTDRHDDLQLSINEVSRCVSPGI